MAQATTTVITRRSMLAGAATAASAIPLAGPTTAAATDADLLALVNHALSVSQAALATDAERDRLECEGDSFQGGVLLANLKRRTADLFDQVDDLLDRISATPAVTAEGHRAKARVVFEFCWLSRMDYRDSDNHDIAVLKSLVCDLLGDTSANITDRAATALA